MKIYIEGIKVQVNYCGSGKRHVTLELVHMQPDDDADFEKIIKMYKNKIPIEV